MAKRVKNMKIPAIDTSEIPAVVLSEERFGEIVKAHIDEMREERNAQAIGIGAGKILMALKAAAGKGALA